VISWLSTYPVRVFYFAAIWHIKRYFLYKKTKISESEMVAHYYTKISVKKIKKI